MVLGPVDYGLRAAALLPLNRQWYLYATMSSVPHGCFLAFRKVQRVSLRVRFTVATRTSTRRRRNTHIVHVVILLLPYQDLTLGKLNEAYPGTGGAWPSPVRVVRFMVKSMEYKYGVTSSSWQKRFWCL